MSTCVLTCRRLRRGLGARRARRRRSRRGCRSPAASSSRSLRTRFHGGASTGRNCAPAKRAQPAEAVRDARERGLDRLGRRDIRSSSRPARRGCGGRCRAAARVTRVVQQAEQLRLGRLRDHRERERNLFRSGKLEQPLQGRQHGARHHRRATSTATGRPASRRRASSSSKRRPAHASHSRSSSALRRAPPRSTAPGAGRGARRRAVDRRGQRRRRERSLLHHLHSPLSASSVARSVCSDFAAGREGHQHRARARLQRFQHRVVPGLAHRKHAVSKAQREIVPEALDDHAVAGARLQASSPGQLSPASTRHGRDRARPISGRAAIAVSSRRCPTAPPPAETSTSPRAGVALGDVFLDHIAGVVQPCRRARGLPKLRSKRATRGSPCTSRRSK